MKQLKSFCSECNNWKRSTFDAAKNAVDFEIPATCKVRDVCRDKTIESLRPIIAANLEKYLRAKEKRERRAARRAHGGL